MSAADDVKARAVEEAALRWPHLGVGAPCLPGSCWCDPSRHAARTDYAEGYTAGLLADPSDLTRAKAEALREWIAEWPPTREGDFLASVARDGLARADRIDPTEGNALCGDYPAPCNCDDPTIHNGHRSDR